MSKKAKFVKVSPSLEVRYQGKVYDVSYLPVTVGQKLLIESQKAEVAVSENGNDWFILREVVPVHKSIETQYFYDDHFTLEEKWLIYVYRSLDKVDQVIIDRLVSRLRLGGSL